MFHTPMICCLIDVNLCFFFFHSPPEKTWSYKCMNHRCVRQHYINKEEKRTTFMTCSMLCGSQTLWPEPTVKSLIGTNANSFRLTDVQYKVQTPFKSVESLMESAFSIFLEEIKQIRHASGGTASEDTTPRSSTRSYRDVTYSSSGARIDTVSHPRRNLTTVNIYINVIKTADVHLSMHTDECYNMTMSSKTRTVASELSLTFSFSFQMNIKRLTCEFPQTHFSALDMRCQLSSSSSGMTTKMMC